MLELSKKNRLPLYIVGSVLLIVLLVFIVIKLTFSSLLSNDVEVETDTDLTYYLDVLYDGVDKYGIASSDSATSEIKSGYILVEDKIPEGLTFTGFVTTEDGTIGAVSRSDATTCYGSVVDDTNESGNVGVWNAGNTEFTYHGLHYDKQSNKVSFKVKNLKAGCKLTVGIITRTPNAVDDPNTTEVEDRRDFYNFASGREDSLSVNSNTVHAYMGLYNATLYNVTYEYEGTVPQGAIDVLPSTQSYGENAKVSLAKNIDIEGYTFSGWSNESLTITNDTFVMPNQNITLKGSFTEKTKNTVTYILTGTTTPEDYVLPSEKYYYPDSYVKLDSLKQGDVLDGYRFLGWESEDVDTSEEEFVMPNKSVTLMGAFEQAKYKVTYAFYDTVLPPNSSSLLPEEQEYIEGEIVSLETVSNPSGYEFLGWYHEDNFEMPNEDITIYGEWREVTGEFEVEIEKEILNIQDYYEAGDTVNFKITVTNPNNFALNDVIVKELNDDTLYSASANYNISSSHFVTIPSLSANSSIEIFASYTMKNDDVIVINTAEVTGALAENGYTLKDEDYTSSVQFGISPKIKVCKMVNGASLQNNFQFKITNSTNTFETYIVLNEDECKEINVVPGSYKVKEILNQEYEIVSVSGDVTLDNSLFTITQGQTKQINYTNKLKNKGFLHSSGSVDNKIEYNLISFVNRQNEGSIATGDEISIAGEHFYVVSSDSNETVLLSKYNLLVGDVFENIESTWTKTKTMDASNTEGYGLQSEIAKGFNTADSTYRIGVVAFSGKGYWDNREYKCNGTSCSATGTGGLKSEYANSSNAEGTTSYNSPYPYVYRSNIGNDVQPQYTYENQSSYAQDNGYTIAYYVEHYVGTLKGLGAPNTITGRLLSYEEANSLSGTIKGNWSYWLGSGAGLTNAWTVSYGIINLSSYWYGNSHGVRPVIEIPTSELESL